MKGKLEFTIPGTMPNLNDIIKAKATVTSRKGKRIRSKYTDMKAAETAKVMALAATARREGTMEGKPLIIIHHYEPTRRRDQDNVHGGARKFVLDGLVKANVLANDGWKDVAHTILAFFEHDPDNPRIEVKAYWGTFEVLVRDMDP